MKHSKHSQKIVERDGKVISPSMTRDYQFVFKRAKGSTLWDVDGHKYIDFAASIAVMNAGYGVPEVMSAVRKQLQDGTHCAFSDFYNETPVKFAESLLGNMPYPLNNGKVFFSNSGAEAVEASVKLAKWSKRVKYAIAFNHCFHGRTMGALSMTNSKPVQREGFRPFLPVRHVPYPYYYRMKMEPGECSDYCIEKLEDTLDKLAGDVACVFMEPIQGEGGYIVPPKNFLKRVRKVCTENGVLMCVDEVQSGFWRTGKFLAVENFNAVPDIVSMAKAIGGGLPLGATIARPGLMKWSKGSHASTFGGNLLACAAGKASMDYIKKKNLGKNAVAVGDFIMKRLEEMKEKYEHVGDVRGIGLMIGVEIVKTKKKRKPDAKRRDQILQDASNNGLIMLGTGESVMRICPPLSITQREADNGLDILEKSIKKISK